METKRLLLWLTGSDMGNMSSAKGILNTVLLPLQLCLALWQIVKLTPLWALMKCTMSWFIMTFFPCLSCCCSDYILLQNFEGRVFKKVICYVTTPVLDLATAPAKEKPNEHSHQYRVQVKYLDQDFILERKLEEKLETRVQVKGKGSVEGEKLYLDNFILERKEGDKLFLNDVPKYYITDEIWQSILCLKEVADRKEVGDKRKVFIKNHKEIWEEVVTGRVMSLEEVLDSVILGNQMVTRLDHEYFLPVDLTLSEEKILRILNLMGLFLQKEKRIHWLIPALLSLTSAVMGLCTTLRRWVYGRMNMVACCLIHFLCDQLDDFWRRRQAYSLGNWIENLRPSNDLQSKIVHGDIWAVVAGGAKVPVDSATATLFEIHDAVKQGKRKDSFKCGTFYIDWEFRPSNDKTSSEAGEQSNGKCWLTAGEIATLDVDCKSEEAMKLYAFAAYMAQIKSGSLKSYDPGTKTVHVRRFRESVIAYVRSGYPPLYALKLDNVVVR